MGKEQVFSGTFLQLDRGLVQWSQSRWEKEFKDFSSLGMRTLIVQGSSYDDISYYPSQSNLFRSKYDIISTLLDCGSKSAVEVYLGLYFSNQWWQSYGQKKFLREEVNRNIGVIRELEILYGSHPAFRGWYIPHEIGNLPSLPCWKRSNLGWFVNTLVSICKQWDKEKPVTIAPYFYPGVGYRRFVRAWSHLLRRSGLDVVMLQDGIGCHRVNIEQAEVYFAQMVKACEEGEVELWGDIEVFDQYQGEPLDAKAFAARPAQIERIKQQIQRLTPYVDRLVCFEYNHYMSLYRNEEEQTLHEQYKRYISLE